MGKQLEGYFEEAKKAGGLLATIKLAKLTRISSMDARTKPDSSENLQMVQKHLREVLNEFGDQKNSNVEQTISTQDDDATTTKKLRKFVQLFADLTATHGLQLHSAKETAKRITPAIAEAIGVERASIWLYNENESAIVCLDLYEQSKKKHTTGTELKKADFPNYFLAIANGKTLSAEDAHTHAGTREFSEPYLTPLGINSMLDVPIFVDGKIAGVVCHEHTGEPRKWTTDEENFAAILGNLVGLSVERTNT